MTTVGTSVAAKPSSILATFGDSGPSRSNGAGSSVDGGFDALFSRALEVDDTSAGAARGSAQALPSLDRRADVERPDRAAAGDEKRSAAVDEPVGRSLEVTDEPVDRAAGTETADEVDDVDRPARPAGDNGSPGDASGEQAVVVPFAAVAPVVQPPVTMPTATPTLVPGADSTAQPLDASVMPNEGSAPATAAATESAVPSRAAAPSIGADAVAAGTAAGAQQSPTAIDATAQAVVPNDPAAGTSVSAPVDGAASATATAGGDMPTAEAPLVDARATAVRETMSSVDSPVAASSVAAATVAVLDADAAGSTDATRSTGSSNAISATSASATSASTASTSGTGTTAGTGTHAGTGTQAGTGTTATTDLRTTTATPERVTELQRMRERAALAGVANGAMSVDLSDEGLGPLTLHALQSAAGVHLTLSAADQSTRDLLASQGSALRNELEAGGTTLGSLDIRHSGAGSSGDRGAGTPSGRVGRADSSRASIERTSSSSLTAVRPRSTPSTDGVDLLI